MTNSEYPTYRILLEATADGSHTLFVPSLNEHYHSTFGAVQESNHVFIDAGFSYVSKHQEINILEVGFGTGLNAFLTALSKGDRRISYTALEAYPVQKAIIDCLNYPEMNGLSDPSGIFQQLHSVGWERFIEIVPGFNLRKIHTKIEVCDLPDNFFHLVYFDAFGPNVQPEMWTDEIFRKIHRATAPGGILVTYSSKGLVKRSLRAAGFGIERLPGAAGKRHMLRALKNES